MKCPYCNSPTKVTNSRSHNNDQSVWRRRQCKNCGAIWSTEESINLDTSHKVINSEKHLEPFKRDILFISITESLAHSNNRINVSTALTDTIIKYILALNSAFISTSEIKKISNDVLNRFDKIAASVYKAKHL